MLKLSRLNCSYHHNNHSQTFEKELHAQLQTRLFLQAEQVSNFKRFDTMNPSMYKRIFSMNAVCPPSSRFSNIMRGEAGGDLFVDLVVFEVVF